MFLSPFTPTSTDEAIQKFVTDYKEAYGGTPNPVCGRCLRRVYAMKAANAKEEKAEVTPDMSASDIDDVLKGAMTEITISGVTAKELDFRKQAEPSKAPMVVKITRTVIMR